jgi:cellulose biosynthesis protein BcsQ
MPLRNRDAAQDEGMFSAASFAAVLGSEGPAPPADDGPVGSPPIVAFYGFRGGAGRTTALAHVALHWASQQRSVLAIDLDLEAPGLDRVLDCSPIEEGKGALTLLRAASRVERAEDEALTLAPHLVESRVDVGRRVRVLPAGRLCERYLVDLDDLAVPLWHVMDGPSPLALLLERVRLELQPDRVLLDCRTGLSPLSASAVFHVADVVVCVVPVSEQSKEGLDVFLHALRSARSRRHGLPRVVLLPSMVPEGAEGQRRLEAFVEHVKAAFGTILLGAGADLDAEVPVVREGVEYRVGLALADAVRFDYLQRAGGTYGALLRQLDATLPGADTWSPPLGLNSEAVLAELKAANLERMLFGDDPKPEQIVEGFVAPAPLDEVRRDPSIYYVVGAKGSGKTWLYRYLLSPTVADQEPQRKFLPGHEPRDEEITKEGFRRLDKKLRRGQLYAAFWRLRALSVLFRAEPGLTEDVFTAAKLNKSARSRFAQLASTAEEGGLLGALEATLAEPNVGTTSEDLLRAADAALARRGERSVTLLYDGLDAGFGSEARDLAARERFVQGLVEALEDLRGRLRRLGFKVFLREDVFAEIRIQNQSHLRAAKVELVWRPIDLWRLTCKLVERSNSYMSAIASIEPGVAPGHWPHSLEELERLLAPLWGAAMEKGHKTSTAGFIQKRTADGRDRLFPRTLVQLVARAVADQLDRGMPRDRVLSSASIQHGYAEASKQRVEDLRKEYVDLAPYLDWLKNRNPTGTWEEIRDDLMKRKRSAGREKGMGAPAGSLHSGPGGWNRVLQRLLEVGVLREYRRARGEAGELKYEIALLYRPGLLIKGYASA